MAQPIATAMPADLLSVQRVTDPDTCGIPAPDAAEADMLVELAEVLGRPVRVWL